MSTSPRRTSPWIPRRLGIVLVSAPVSATRLRDVARVGKAGAGAGAGGKSTGAGASRALGSGLRGRAPSRYRMTARMSTVNSGASTSAATRRAWDRVMAILYFLGLVSEPSGAPAIASRIVVSACMFFIR
jgi:hypothetical protein